MPKKRTPLENPFDPCASPPIDRTKKPNKTPTPQRVHSPLVSETNEPPKHVPAYAIFNTPETTPVSSTPNTNTSNSSPFWVCIALPTGQMLKLKSEQNQSLSEFRRDAITQLTEVVSFIEKNLPFTTPESKMLNENDVLSRDPYVNQELQKQQVPTFWLTLPKPSNIHEPSRPTSPGIRRATIAESFSNSGPLPNSARFLTTTKERRNTSSPSISRGAGDGVFGLMPASSPSGGRRKKYHDLLDTVPLGFDQLEEGRDRDKTQTLLIESILVQSYAKLKLHDQDDEESALFKRNIIPTARRIQVKTKLSYAYAIQTDLQWPPNLSKMFSVTFNFPVNNVAKSMEITPDTVVENQIRELLSTSHVQSIKEKHISSVILKFCDYEEYLHPKMTFGMLVRIRDDLFRRRAIRFSVIDKETLARFGEPESVEAMYQPRSTTDLFSLTAPPVPAKNSLSVLELDYNFQVRILEIENFTDYFPVYAQDMELPSNPNSFQVCIELYHGPEHIAPPIWCEPLKSPKFDEWVGAPALKVCQLPRATKVCFTLYVKNYKEMIPLGWVNLQMFDHYNVLKSGAVTLPLWLNGKANPLSPCSVNIDSSKPMTLTVEFPTYSDRVVTYPSFSHHLHVGEPQKADTSLELSSRLSYIIAQDPLYRMSQNEKNLLWESRKILQAVPDALPKVLQVVDWTNPDNIVEMIKLMATWARLPGSSALQLLDAHYPAPEVREYAVNCLRNVPDIDIEDYMLQLVQVLKYEPFHDSPLSRFLLQRALQNRERLGHLLFWYLKAELSVPHISQRYTLLAEAYLYGCGDHLFELTHQIHLVDRLQKIADTVKNKKKGKRQVLYKELNDMKFEHRIRLPIVPSMTINGFVVEKCKYMDSFTLPLWLECKNNDPFGSPIKMIFKNGDDLRADILTLQMFRIMDKIWKNAGLDLQLSPYMCTATDNEAGMIEVVKDAVTTASIQKEKGVVTGALKKTPLAKWLREKNPSDFEYDQAVDNFVASLAGYCVATFLLGIGDRHNDNIMITTTGQLFHIDFAHILGNVQTWQGIKRERAPFVLTPEFKYVMGKRKSSKFKKFVNVCANAYLVLRKHANLFISLFSMMLSTGIPELKCDEDINYLRNAFALGKTEKEAARFFVNLIDESLNTKATQVNFLIHNLAHAT